MVEGATLANFGGHIISWELKHKSLSGNLDAGKARNKDKWVIIVTLNSSRLNLITWDVRGLYSNETEIIKILRWKNINIAILMKTKQKNEKKYTPWRHDIVVQRSTTVTKRKYGSCCTNKQEMEEYN